MPFTGKVALVTGGSRGIGRAISIELARKGAAVIVNYSHNHREANEVVSTIKQLGRRSIAVRAHLGNPSNIEKMFSIIKDEFGGLDILVNNAASGVQKTALDLEIKHWDWTMNINTKAPWLCSKEAVKLMTNGGRIINISSLGSQLVLDNYMAVGISKAGLEALTRYLAVQLAPKGIVVNAVAGGIVDTDALKHFPNRLEMISKSGSKTPAGRLVTPEDMAAAVSFLCSEGADMIRGQVVVVDGGISLVGI